MPLNNNGLEVMADGPGLAPSVTHVSLHSADPGTTGANETTAARQPIVWDTSDLDGDITIDAAESFTGGASGGPVLYVGLWDALTTGTFYGSFAIPGGEDLAFNADGNYTLTALTINGTAA